MVDFNVPPVYSEREHDTMVKAIILAAGGEVRISPLDMERARNGYDLIIEGSAAHDDLIVRAVERR